MNKYETGVYRVHLFDKHGTRIKTLLRKSYLKAVKKGAKKCRKPPFASFSVTRVLHNSVDQAYPWSVRPEDVVKVDD